MARGSIKNLAIKDRIKSLASNRLKMAAFEREQIGNFTVFDGKMDNQQMFSQAVEGIFGTAKATLKEPPGYKSDSGDIIPVGNDNNYQVAIISTGAPVFSDDIGSYRDKKFKYGFKDRIIYQDDPLEDKMKHALALDDEDMTSRFSGGWFKDGEGDAAEYKLLIVLPNPKTVFNRVVKVLDPASPPAPAQKYFLKTVMDRRTRYAYDYPLYFGIRAYNQVFLEYSLLFLDDLVLSHAELKSSAVVGTSSRKFGERKDSNFSLEDIHRDFQTAGGKVDRLSMVARRVRNAVDLDFAPDEDNSTENGPNKNWAKTIRSTFRSLKTPPREAIAPPEDEGMAFLKKQIKKPEDGPVEDKSGAITYDGMTANRIYRISDLARSSLMTAPSGSVSTGLAAYGDFLDRFNSGDEDDYSAMNAWTSVNNPALAVSAQWTAGVQGPAVVQTPDKGASITVTVDNFKRYEMDGTDEVLSTRGPSLNWELDRLQNLENGYDIAAAIANYNKSVNKGRIGNRPGGGAGRRQTNPFEQNTRDNSLDKINSENKKDLLKEIEAQIAINKKYKNTNYPQNIPAEENFNGMMGYIVALELYLGELKKQTPMKMDVLESILRSPDGDKKIRRGDINFLRLIFD